MNSANINTVATTAMSFINDYLAKHHYFTPSDEADEADENDDGVLRLSLYRAMPDMNSSGTIEYVFIYGAKVRKNSPELQQWVQQIMDALKETHPEVSQFESAIRLNAWDY
ncbi:hypothetical protein [Myxococcus faecalis]|uniref:hypothetical protein n=1 Tax=Myxococcus faecalis TaxID=3115646 RepID=UPI003CEFF823